MVKLCAFIGRSGKMGGVNGRGRFGDREINEIHEFFSHAKGGGSATGDKATQGRQDGLNPG